MFALTPEAQGDIFVSIILAYHSHSSESASLFSVPTDLMITNGTRCDVLDLANALQHADTSPCQSICIHDGYSDTMGTHG